MQQSGWFGRLYWNLRYWADHYWYEREESVAGEPKIVLEARKQFIFLAEGHPYLFNALKIFTYPAEVRRYIFNAEKQYIFKASET